jgi:hypothetical protein
MKVGKRFLGMVVLGACLAVGARASLAQVSSAQVSSNDHKDEKAKLIALENASAAGHWSAVSGHRLPCW